MKIIISDIPRRPALAGLLVCLTLMTPLASSCGHAGTFGDDVVFLKKYTDLVVLSDPAGAAQVALAPAWQGRVMTSTAGGADGASFGWINRELIAAGKL